MIRQENADLERELLRAKESLKQLEAHFAEFVQRIAHDVQAPVKKILSFTDLLEMKLPPELAEPTRDYLRRIETNAATLSKIINQLREYAVHGAPVPHKEPVDLNKALESAQTALREKIEDIKPSFTAAHLPTIAGSSIQLIRLWQNLLLNALLYRREQPVQIEINAQKNGDEWIFSIKDNGQGIDETSQGRLFQIFPAVNGQDRPSTGVGLALARRIVENHGGRIWCESVPGQGSTFFFSLPA